MKFNGIEKAYNPQPSEIAWAKRLGLVEGKAAKSGACVTRIASDSEARRYGIDLAIVRSARARKAAATRKRKAAATPEREVLADMVERIAEGTAQVLA